MCFSFQPSVSNCDIWKIVFSSCPCSVNEWNITCLLEIYFVMLCCSVLYCGIPCVLNIVLCCYVFCCAVLATISSCVVPHFSRGSDTNRVRNRDLCGDFTFSGQVWAHGTIVLCKHTWSIDRPCIASRLVQHQSLVSIAFVHTKIIFRLGPLFAFRVVQDDERFSSRFGWELYCGRTSLEQFLSLLGSESSGVGNVTWHIGSIWDIVSIWHIGITVIYAYTLSTVLHLLHITICLSFLHRIAQNCSSKSYGLVSNFAFSINVSRLPSNSFYLNSIFVYCWRVLFAAWQTTFDVLHSQTTRDQNKIALL